MSSERLLSVDCESALKISSCLDKHKSHFFDPDRYGLARLMIFHVIFESLPAVFAFHTAFDSSVALTFLLS